MLLLQRISSMGSPVFLGCQHIQSHYWLQNGRASKVGQGIGPYPAWARQQCLQIRCYPVEILQPPRFYMHSLGMQLEATFKKILQYWYWGWGLQDWRNMVYKTWLSYTKIELNLNIDKMLLFWFTSAARSASAPILYEVATAVKTVLILPPLYPTLKDSCKHQKCDHEARIIILNWYKN